MNDHTLKGGGFSKREAVPLSVNGKICCIYATVRQQIFGLIKTQSEKRKTILLGFDSRRKEIINTSLANQIRNPNRRI